MSDNGRTRFLKMYVIIVEEGGKWMLTLVENKVRVKKSLPLLQYMKSSQSISNNNTIKNRLSSISSTSELDISALYVVVQDGKYYILDPSERKTSVRGVPCNTIGDAIENIREIRNSIMHTTEATFDEQDYKDMIRDIKTFAGFFETANGEPQGTYAKKIDEIDRKHFDEEERQNVTKRYKVYVELVIQFELAPSIDLSITSGNAPERARGRCNCFLCHLLGRPWHHWHHWH